MALDKSQKERLPSTIARSAEKAQSTYIHTLEAAEQVHGDGEAAIASPWHLSSTRSRRSAITGKPRNPPAPAMRRMKNEAPKLVRATHPPQAV